MDRSVYHKIVNLFALKGPPAAKPEKNRVVHTLVSHPATYVFLINKFVRLNTVVVAFVFVAIK